tara:strand:- start:220 stop:438 length:219 start_codon:yes stop_codon:yes gene_type:complete
MTNIDAHEIVASEAVPEVMVTVKGKLTDEEKPAGSVTVSVAPGAGADEATVTPPIRILTITGAPPPFVTVIA